MHQYRELEEKYQASRKVIHDVKNHIQMIRNCITWVIWRQRMQVLQ